MSSIPRRAVSQCLVAYLQPLRVVYEMRALGPYPIDPTLVLMNRELTPQVRSVLIAEAADKGVNTRSVRGCAFQMKHTETQGAGRSVKVRLRCLTP